MYDRLVNYHGIKNLIWVYTKQPNDDAFYPGDAYVDIVGRDYYDTGNHTSVVNEFTSISSKFGNKKMTTITECGSFPDPDNLTNDAAKWSWYMVWAGDFVRSSTYNSLDLWKKAFASSYVLTLDEMPNLKTYGGTTSTASVSNGTYQITFKHSGKSLAVENALTTDGANVIQNPYAGTNNEKWFVQDQGSGQYSIKNVNATGRGLDVVSSSTASPADINIWYYSGGNNQKFKIEAVGSYYRIVNVNSGKCIDMAGSSQNNVSIQQYDCNNADNQLFTFTKLNSNTSRVASEEEPNAELNTIVAPNPSENQFTITQSGAFTFGVYDVLGTVQEKGEGIDKAIFGKNLKTGMYILKVESEGKSKSIKVIKTQ